MLKGLDGFSSVSSQEARAYKRRVMDLGDSYNQQRHSMINFKTAYFDLEE